MEQSTETILKTSNHSVSLLHVWYKKFSKEWNDTICEFYMVRMRKTSMAYGLNELACESNRLLMRFFFLWSWRISFNAVVLEIMSVICAVLSINLVRNYMKKNTSMITSSLAQLRSSLLLHKNVLFGDTVVYGFSGYDWKYLMHLWYGCIWLIYAEICISDTNFDE